MAGGVPSAVLPCLAFLLFVPARHARAAEAACEALRTQVLELERKELDTTRAMLEFRALADDLRAGRRVAVFLQYGDDGRLILADISKESLPGYIESMLAAGRVDPSKLKEFTDVFERGRVTIDR